MYFPMERNLQLKYAHEASCRGEPACNKGILYDPLSGIIVLTTFLRHFMVEEMSFVK